jgi:hypothetical protein
MEFAPSENYHITEKIRALEGGKRFPTHHLTDTHKTLYRKMNTNHN